MEALATYLIKSSVWLTGFSLIYFLFLRNERFFVLNRILLVCGILISLIFPLFTWHYTVLLPVVPSVEISEPQVIGVIAAEESFAIQNALLFFYLSGVIMLIFRLFRQTLPVFRIIKQSEIHQYPSAKLIRTAEYPASFSFFSFVFVNPSIDEIETNEIVNHEIEHIRQRHWIDLLLFEILRMMQWFNPVIWLYGHFIRQNHEFLADERALQRTSNPAIYRAALLNQMFGGPVISLANSFNYSLNKKRFNMMKQTISSPIRKLKLLLVLPLIAGVFYAFAAPEYKFENVTENQGNEKPLYLISKEKINIKFTTQLQKGDLEAIKSELAKMEIQIDYTSLDFSENGNLKQISALIKGSSGSVNFTSENLTATNYPTFKKEANGSFGIYFQRAVSGKVIDENGIPMKGASVIISGTTSGTVTDANGNFKLIFTDNLPIVVSYVGFESQKVNPDFEKEMIITMKTMTVGIEAMGNEAPVSEKTAQSKLNFDSTLVLVNGIELPKSVIENLNPDDFLSVNVIKEKSALSKYGKKGKKGVVEITVKNGELKGKNGPIKISGYSKEKNDEIVLNPSNQIKIDGINVFENKPVPLIVMDGVITDNRNLDNINPETFESINVLKGEAANNKYGEKAKHGVVEITTKKTGDVFTMVEEMPQFPGGFEALKTYVASTMKYPVIALENGIHGQVTVKFVVDKTGGVTNAKIRSGVDPALDKEALRIVNSLPKWNPGKQNGEAVDVAYEMPINFKLPADAPRKQKLITMSGPYKASKTIPAVDQASKTNQLIIVPNPTKDKATITLEGITESKRLEVSIFDSNGQLRKKESKKGPSFSLSFSSLVSGTYLVVVQDGNTQYSGQIVVNH